MRIILLISLMVVFACGPVCAQEPPSPEKMQKEMEKMRKEAETRQQEALEVLKKADPTGYQQRKDALDTQGKINTVVTAFQQKEITATQAESELYPLVKQEVQSSVDTLAAEIARVEKRLEYLKKAKADPDFLVQKRIDALLGKSVPSPEEVF